MAIKAVVLPPAKKTPKLVAWEKSAIIAACAERDGWRCCYCEKRVTLATVTIEHFVARSFGGPNHTSNYGLACQPCNQTVADKSVAEKFRYAFDRRASLRSDRVSSTMKFIRERIARHEALSR